MEINLSSTVIVAIAGAAVSWVFSYTPKLSEWYNARTSAQKGLIMFVAMIALGAAAFGVSCANSPFDLGITCNEDGAWYLVWLILSAAGGNQLSYLYSPQKKAPAVIQSQPEGESPFIDYPVPADDPDPIPDPAFDYYRSLSEDEKRKELEEAVGRMVSKDLSGGRD